MIQCNNCGHCHNGYSVCPMCGSTKSELIDFPGKIREAAIVCGIVPQIDDTPISLFSKIVTKVGKLTSKISLLVEQINQLESQRDKLMKQNEDYRQHLGDIVTYGTDAEGLDKMLRGAIRERDEWKRAAERLQAERNERQNDNEELRTRNVNLQGHFTQRLNDLQERVAKCLAAFEYIKSRDGYYGTDFIVHIQNMATRIIKDK